MKPLRLRIGKLKYNKFLFEFNTALSELDQDNLPTNDWCVPFQTIR